MTTPAPQVDLVRKSFITEELKLFSESFLNHELIEKRKINTYKVGKLVFVSISEIQEFIKSHKVKK